MTHHIIDQLRSRRIQIGLSQDAIAERAGVNRTTINRWESGRSLGLIRKLDRWCREIGMQLTVAPLGEQ